ncbi:SH3 domain-containing protein [Beauveria bassiana]|nr:SH3 domain-containing protein [Beauveria bassiana]KAH8710481.1 SH3 domain-containing protein [Beauveria bassiana]
MQKITSHLPSWNTTKSQSKKGFDKAYKVVDKLGAPINRLSNRIGSEAFWPTTLDKESDKAARILKSFCKDGFYTEQDDDAAAVPGDGPKQKQRVLKKIPQSVIANAVGLAIFTTMRTGLWVSGAGGSGVLVARQEHDGAWSPPSGIMLHTAGLGFLVGVDIYDCVLVINTRAALAAFTKIRATIGGEVSAVAGPVGVGGVLENDGRWKQANRPVFTYLKSRGFYAGVQVDGTVVIERSDENARFYNETGIAAADILAGKVRRPPRETRKLMETLKAAEGRVDVDDDIMEQLEHELAPGDVHVTSPNATATTFGFPEEDDPDPYGVAALEKEGLGIVEAGSHARVSSDEFTFRPRSGYRSRANTASSTPTHRTSFGAAALAQNPRWSRDSVATTTSDAATQTEIDQSPEETSSAPPSSHSHSPRVLTRHHHHVQADEPPRYEEQGREHIDEKAQSPYSAGADGRLHGVNGHEEEEDGFADAEEAVVKPVVLPKGPPPALPPRQSAETKPVDAGFEELDLNDSKH